MSAYLTIVSGCSVAMMQAGPRAAALDAGSLETALSSIHKIEEQLRGVLPGLKEAQEKLHPSKAEAQPQQEEEEDASSLDAQLLAEAEAKEAEAERELIAARRHTAVVGLRYRKHVVALHQPPPPPPPAAVQTTTTHSIADR